MKRTELDTKFLKQGSARFVLLILIFLPSLGWGLDRSQCFSPEKATAGLQVVFDHALSQPNIVNTVMLVQSHKDDFLWVQAGGIANPVSGEQMTTAHQFRIASITKMMTAVVTMQLVEQEYLSLDSKLGDLLSTTDMPPGVQVADLNIYGGHSYGNEITVRQLLNHTAGLRDYVFDDATATGFAPNSLAMAVLGDVLGIYPTGISHKQWSPQELLGWYLGNGLAANALFPPGKGYHYGDTGYLLLGIIIEKVTGTSLAAQYRQRIFEPLAMNSSYLEWYEPAWGEGPAHHFIDVSPFGYPLNIDVVAAGVNTSFDWGGGGVVSTAADLNTFLRTLFQAQLFQNPETLKTMLRSVKEEPKIRYGLGIDKNRVGGTLFLGHGGAWGGEADYVDGNGMTIVLTLDQWIVAANGGAYRDSLAKAMEEASRPCQHPFPK